MGWRSRLTIYTDACAYLHSRFLQIHLDSIGSALWCAHSGIRLADFISPEQQGADAAQFQRRLQRCYIRPRSWTASITIPVMAAISSMSEATRT